MGGLVDALSTGVVVDAVERFRRPFVDRDADPISRLFPRLRRPDASVTARPTRQEYPAAIYSRRGG